MNVRWRMSWLDGIWGTPEYHHWHHSAHAEAVNHNYSGFLPVLDRLFGTYYMPAERRPELYGVEEHVPHTWLGQMLFPFRRQRRTPVAF
jgi:sterol desaturase/sphingolipid hydroxylase (fatty acid hydroxylase superfamily)